MYTGILPVQIDEHAHVEGEVLHGDIPVLRHDQMDAYHVESRRNDRGLRARQQKAGEHLRERYGFGFAARDLGQKALLDLTARTGLRRAAVHPRVALRLRLLEAMPRGV